MTATAASWPTCTTCPATLLGDDPPGGRCRNCNPRRKATA